MNLNELLAVSLVTVAAGGKALGRGVWIAGYGNGVIPPGVENFSKIHTISRVVVEVVIDRAIAIPGDSDVNTARGSLTGEMDVPGVTVSPVHGSVYTGVVEPPRSNQRQRS